MKRRVISMAIMAGVLVVSVACSANASTPELLEEKPVSVEEAVKPEPLAQEEKQEISQEALEAIFETVYLSAVDSHPDDWNESFCITDEVGKITAAIPEDVKAPADLRAIYTEWREAQTEQDTPEPPAPEAEEPAISEPPAEPIAQQPATSSNNGNSSGGNGTISQSQESSSTSGSSDDWRKNIIPNAEGYGDLTDVEVTYNDPNAIRGNIGGSAPSTTDTDSTTTPAPSTNTDTGSSGESQLGFTVPAGHHLELCADGKTYKLVNDETGRYEIVSGVDMTGYVAGEGQIESESAARDTGIRFES